jgi:hypothetical protein
MPWLHHASLVMPSTHLVMHQESSAQLVTQEQALEMQVQVNKGIVTHNHVKKLQQEVHAFLSELRYNIDESHILPKSGTVLLLRITQQDSSLGYVKDAVLSKLRRVTQKRLKVT